MPLIITFHPSTDIQNIFKIFHKPLIVSLKKVVCRIDNIWLIIKINSTDNKNRAKLESQRKLHSTTHADKIKQTPRFAINQSSCSRRKSASISTIILLGLNFYFHISWGFSKNSICYEFWSRVRFSFVLNTKNFLIPSCNFIHPSHHIQWSTTK